jgi:hypothetical protein
MFCGQLPSRKNTVLMYQLLGMALEENECGSITYPQLFLIAEE